MIEKTYREKDLPYNIVFDIGNVLRQVAMPNQPERDWDVMVHLYKTMMDAEDTEVIIVTAQPTDSIEERDLEWVERHLRSLGIPYPDRMFITYTDANKRVAYEKVGAQIVIDDKEYNIQNAIEAGAFPLQAR